MTTIYLARHGAHDEVGRVLSGRSEIALNALGREQAKWLGERLTGAGVGTIVTSPRRRARETAEILAAPLAVRLETDRAVDEIDFGDWSGQTFEQLEQDLDWRRWNRARGRAVTPAGDTMVQVVVRAFACLQRLGQGPAPALVVSHCDVIRGLVARAIGLGMERVQTFSVDPGSLTTLEVRGSILHLTALNERMPG